MNCQVEPVEGSAEGAVMWTLVVLCSAVVSHRVHAVVVPTGSPDAGDAASRAPGQARRDIHTINLRNSTFMSRNYPNNYPHQSDVTWYLRPPGSQKIVELKFSFVDVEYHPNCSLDSISVYDGLDVSSRLLGTFCGTRTPTFYSTGHSMTVHFQSNTRISGRGFRAHFGVVSQGSCRYNCGYQVGSCSCSSSCRRGGNCCSDFQDFCSSTQLAPTTGGPSCRYNCGWHMGSCSCSSSCQYQGNCCYDYYSQCQSTTVSPTTAGLSCLYNCGRNLGSCSCASLCQYQGNCCYDYSSQCSFTTDMQTTEEPCGGSRYDAGILSSPNYPNYYHNNAYCVWQLRASFGQRIHLTFTYLQLENCCSCDYVSIYDGPSVNSPYLGKVCNGSTGKSLQSSSNYMTVVFRTDSSGVGRGFKAEFLSTLPSSAGRVDCSSENMNIVIGRSYLNSLGYDSNSLNLNDPHCRPRVLSDHVVFNFPIYTCGTVLKFEDGRAVYTNTLRASNFVSGEITRQSTLNLFVSCRMDQESVSQIMYLAPNNNNSITGTGTYNTSMAFYTSSGFYNQVTQSPYEVALNQNLYVQVNLQRYESNLVLYLDTCVASPSPTDFQSRAFYLVRNGCPEDSTYQVYTTGSNWYARFTFKAFQFQRAAESVYLQCKVLICQSSDYDSPCRQRCNKRRARELGSEHDSQTLVLGPIQLKGP